MRIVSGLHRGKRITAPNNLPVRPTTDMAKESLFNILNNSYYLEDLTVLDLFAGIGSISFEFASRGSTNITSVDQHQGCIQFLKKIDNELDLGLHIVKSDVYPFLDKNSGKYDIIFADPPYGFELEKFQKIIALVFTKELLNENGLLIVEHSKHTDLSQIETFQKSKTYGGNCFSFFGQ